MIEKRHKNLLPIATVEQALAFDPENPESRTPSRIVNEVVAAMGKVEAANRVLMSRHLGISETALDGAIELDTGLTFIDFIEKWRYESLVRARRNGQTRFTHEFARSLGFANNSSLWHFMKRYKLLANQK